MKERNEMANIGATTAFYKVETSLRANSEVSKSMERLATGKQNANAGDRSSYVAMADTFRLDFVGTKAGIKGASVTMGYLETGMRVLTLPLHFFPDCKSWFWVRTTPIQRLIMKRSTWKRKLRMSNRLMTTSIQGS